MKINWPPKPLGIGTPLNLALASSETRARLAQSAWVIPVAGFLTALSMLAADYAFFDGVTMSKNPPLNAHPPIGSRVLVAILGSLGEELVFRVGVATLAAWLAYHIARFVSATPRRFAQAIGVSAAALCVGLMHFNQVGQASEFWRLMTLNLVGHVVHGWMYFFRGLEAAVLTHMVVTLLLYIGLPAIS